ncbi:SusC/RagA family TonB-linked outer membrane protein [Pedobacter sp. N23S346]|uniref:SusC/RagA family TonB-linked outer membrane protein n=1 Tax=Pedobacter sp. N23S346 TaxID=3402750 RepID=UPI003ACD76D9
MIRNLTKPIYYLLSVIFLLNISYPVSAQEKTITIEAALNAISKKYKTKFAYEHAIIQGKFTPAGSLKAKSLDESLKRVLYPNNLLFLYVSEGSYTIVSRDDKTLQKDASATPLASRNDNIEEFYLTGKVSDETGSGLPGVTIKSDGSNRATMTDRDGKFAFFVPKMATSISFSYIGYQTAIQSVISQPKNLMISLSPTAGSQLNDVNIISNGYQVLPKERSTGAAVEVKATDLEKIKTPNLVQRLENQVAGLKVDLNSDNMFTYGNTQVGINSGTRSLGRSDYSMTIRGASTIRGESFPLVVIDGAISELDLSALNPNDVESITFLKDAAAASIWGVRAANGVIVVTTKKGSQNQAPKISFSASATVSNKPDLSYLNLMNASQAIAYEQDLVAKNLITAPNALNPFGQPVAGVTDLTFQLRAGRITQAAYNEAIAKYSTINSLDQISQYLLRSSNNQQYDFSVSGGGKSSDYFYSASYSKENPQTVGVDGQRLTFTLNNNFKLFKVATLSTNVKGSFFKFNNNGQALNTLLSPSSTTFMPYNQLVDDQGNRVSYSMQYYSGWTNSLQSRGYLNWNYNSLDEMDNADNSQEDNNYTVNLNLNVPIFKGLSANAFYGNERSFSNSRSYFNEQTYRYRNLVNGYTPLPVAGAIAANSIGLSPGSGILATTNTTGNNYTLRGQLNYDNIFNGIHQLTMIAGSEIRQTKIGQGTNTLYGYNMGNGLARPVDFFTPYSTIQGFSSSLNGSPGQQDKTRRYLSYYSNAAYTFKSKYTLSGSVRYDDYNNFGVDRKFRATPLWSTGLKWDVAKESFLSNAKWINNLSIRATYGVNGNISTNTYPFTYIALASSDLTTGLPYASIISPANPELRWEKTTVANLGIDFGLLNNRLSGAVDIYTKRGKDLFYEFPINGTYGVTSLFRNVTSLSGNGVDLNLRGVIVRNDDFEMNSGINFAYNNNKITDARFALTSSFYSNPAYGNLLNDYPNDKIFVYRNAGLDAAGLTQVFNEKGTKVSANQNVTSIDALSYAGRRNAPYFGNFNTNFRYKKLTLMAVASYQFGNVFLRPTISAYPAARTGVKYDLNEDITKRWIKAGDEAITNVPGAGGTFAGVSLLRYQQSDINVLKGDYVRLRELSLTYQLPVEQFTKLVRSANFAFAVRNLGLIWTANKEGYDPDFVSGLTATTLGLPSAVSYNFSLNVNF